MLKNKKIFNKSFFIENNCCYIQGNDYVYPKKTNMYLFNLSEPTSLLAQFQQYVLFNSSIKQKKKKSIILKKNEDISMSELTFLFTQFQ